MFVHWGVYSQIAGEWKGENKYSEFVMLNAKIPCREYEKVAATFNPINYDAEKWVKAAKKAGMKYIVFTSKHHEGFAMYKSACSTYNIYDFTPFRRDPLKELELACRKYGVKLGIYYSLGRDWHDPDVPTNWPTKGGRSNTWDFPDEDKKDINRYLERKAKPQIQELLEQYHPDIFWFDTPELTPRAQSESIRKMILDFDPNIIINERIGNKCGDFVNKEQRQSGNIIPGYWEACITMSRNWGYMKADNAFKSSEKLIGILVDVVSKGGNLLLNVGPKPDGTIQKRNLQRMDSIGDWMKVNGEAIYNSRPWVVYGEDILLDEAQLFNEKTGDEVADKTTDLHKAIRYTQANGYLYLILKGWKRGEEVQVKSLLPSRFEIADIKLLGSQRKVEWKQGISGTTLTIPSKPTSKVPVYVFRLNRR